MEKKIIYCNCICKNNKKRIEKLSKIIKCNFCRLYSHKECLPYLNMSSKDFICPECQLILINPLSRFQLILLYPTFLSLETSSLLDNINPYLVKETKNNNIKSNVFEFNIPDNYYLFDSIGNELLNIFIVIYCLKLKGKGFKNEWPLNTSLYINESLIKFTGSKKYLIDNNKRYLPLIFSYNSQIEYFFGDNYYEKGKGNQNFMEKNIFALVKDCFVPGKNVIRFTFENDNKKIKKNNLYVITIRREYFITPKFAVNILLQNSYICFYNKNYVEKLPLFKEKGMKEKLFDQKFKSKGFFCKHSELFDVFSLLQSFFLNGMPLVCPICKEMIGNFRVC